MSPLALCIVHHHCLSALNLFFCNFSRLNHLIRLNNGDATFNHYSHKDLIVEDILVYTVQPYMDGENLHFIGTL